MQDATLLFIGVYLIMGFLTLVGETVFEGEFVQMVVWDFKGLDNTNSFLALLILCVGLWPGVWLYEIVIRFK